MGCSNHCRYLFTYCGYFSCKILQGSKIQTQANELEFRIKKYELETIEKKQADADKACVEARIIKMGAGKHRLKVWNSGKATAYNVVAWFEKDAVLLIMDNGKMPYDELEPNKNFKLSLITHGGTAPKFRITTEWVDANGEQHSKTQMGNI